LRGANYHARSEIHSQVPIGSSRSSASISRIIKSAIISVLQPSSSIAAMVSNASLIVSDLHLTDLSSKWRLLDGVKVQCAIWDGIQPMLIHFFAIRFGFDMFQSRPIRMSQMPIETF
jgi:uncharacterized membrane protein YhaH (DUF805 family)